MDWSNKCSAVAEMGDRLATIDVGPKIGGGLCPFLEDWFPIERNVAKAEAYLYAKFHLDPSNRLATVHQRHRQTRQDRQTTNGPADSIGRIVLQTIAQKRNFYPPHMHLSPPLGVISSKFHRGLWPQKIRVRSYCAALFA